MNEYIEKIISKVFENAGESDKIRELREELSNNCLEHFNDLCAQGKSREEAAAEIEESLKGMDEVIAAIRGEAENDMPAELPAAVSDALNETVCCNKADGFEYASEGIKTLLVNAREQDISFEPSPDDNIRLRIEPDNDSVNVRATKTGDSLKLEIRTADTDESTAAKTGSEQLQPAQKIELFLKRVLRSNVIFGFGEAVKVSIYVPVGILNVSANTASGNITSADVHVSKVVFSAASGDITAAMPGKTHECILESRSGDIFLRALAGNVRLSSTSGDIRFDGGAGALESKTASGDISIEGDFETCRAESRSGDAELNVNAAEIRCSSSSGDVSINGNVRLLECNTTSGDIETEAALETCSLSSTSGDVTLDLRSAKQLKAADVNTISGDIDIIMNSESLADFRLSSVSGDVNNPFADCSGACAVKARSVSGDISVR
ncbi:MAG: DUF4097 family beta strand repeat protein [Clostridia bacterium]|nr:DUF4097 family beta strand repeat protein [Clostridia bacterium]